VGCTSTRSTAMSPGPKDKFKEYARYCSELARQADTPERRERLLKMAREYMQAAEDEPSRRGSSDGSCDGPPVSDDPSRA
jgi:hypothetical protein